MPSFSIPESGLSFDGPPPAGSSKPDSTAPNAIGLTLTNAMIEDMIKCVQDGKPIQLSLGPSPSLSFGSKSQHLSTFDDPFTHELYRTSTPSDPEHSSKPESNMRSTNKPNNKPHMTWSRQFSNKSFVPAKKGPPPSAKATTTSRESFGTEEDPALKTLRNSLQSETDKKKENVMIDTPGRIRGQAPKAKNRNALLSHNNRFSDTTRSMPASPVTNALNSPKQGPTSVPLSQQQAELSKAARKPVVHLLALDSMSEEALEAKLPEISNKDLQQALNKVADLDEGSKKWNLRRAFYKELDVWKFEYDSQEIRQKVIDNAIKVFDKMRLSQNEPEWEKLKPKSQRGDGVSLSKIQAKIAQGPIPRTPKIHVEKADSGRDTPNREDRDLLGDKTLPRGKGEAMARSSSQPPTTKSKKTSEKEAQSKRLLSNPSKKPAPKVTSKKEASKPHAKPLSKERITESDEDDDDIGKEKPAAPATVPKKRARDEESPTSSDSSIPLSKKIKKPAPAHRVSDASQSSRNTATTTTTSSSKTKGNSPQKSSPLASSPPTNASDFEDSSSSSSTPAHHVTTKNSRSPIHKRHQKSSSVTSSTSSSGFYANLKPHVLELAAKYRLFYPKYAALYRELSADAENRDQKKETTLFDMHDRLLKMKNEIKEATAAAEMEM